MAIPVRLNNEGFYVECPGCGRTCEFTYLGTSVDLVDISDAEVYEDEEDDLGWITDLGPSVFFMDDDPWDEYTLTGKNFYPVFVCPCVKCAVTGPLELVEPGT